MAQPDTPTQGHTKGSSKCGCTVKTTGSHTLDRETVYCPLHAAAPETAAQRDRLLPINAELLAVATAVRDDIANGTLENTSKRAERIRLQHIGALTVAIAAATTVQP